MIDGPNDMVLRNMKALMANPYPGRGLVVGTSQDSEHAVQIYWIMGRSENSRNRIFSFEGGRLFTEAADPSKVKDPSLIIYNAMDEYRGNYVVSNGDQTDTVVKKLEVDAYASLADALSGRVFEPDAPNFTPRITGLSTFHEGKFLTEISILRRSGVASGSNCERFCFRYENLISGFGMCITTYTGDGCPLASFTGEPYVMPIQPSIDEVATTYWGMLNAENRVSLAVKFINAKTGKSQIRVINQYSKI